MIYGTIQKVRSPGGGGRGAVKTNKSEQEEEGGRRVSKQHRFGITYFLNALLSGSSEGIL